MKIDVKKFIISMIIPFIAGGIGSYATYPQIITWYASLVKPSFQPPNSLFGPVWTVLYITMGLALYLIWTDKASATKKKASYSIFGIQLFLNTLWSIVFFGMNSPIGGLIVILPLWLTIIFMIKEFSKIHKGAAAMMVPYLLWVTFASFLNTMVFILN